MSGPAARIRLAVLLLAAVLAGPAAHADESESLSPRPFVTFFPPLPPIYGAPVDNERRTRTTWRGQAVEAPDFLSEFVGEFFYPALGSRIFTRGLTKKMAVQVDAYRRSRDALLAELTVKLAELQSADPDTRERELRALAIQQASGLAALETDAETLRYDLVHGGWLLGSTSDWNVSRGWRLGEPAVAADPWRREAEFQVMRAAAYYQDGLGVQQRGLLRELAIELGRVARKTLGRPPRPGDDPKAMFFAPEGARLVLPTKLPAPLLEKIGRFNGAKLALRQELFAVAVEVDAFTPGRRTSRFAALVDRQHAPFAQLDALAEEIRRDLVRFANTPVPWLPPLSSDLQQRIAAYNRDRTALMTEFNAALAQARDLEAWLIDLLQQDASDRAATMRERAERQANAQRRAAEEFQRVNADRVAQMKERYQALHEELSILASTLQDPETKRPLTFETLLAAYRFAMQRFDAIGREEVMYPNYKAAMLEPGLSPAQRRLLFNAAHAALAQALPAGEITPLPLPRPFPQS